MLISIYQDQVHELGRAAFFIKGRFSGMVFQTILKGNTAWEPLKNFYS